MAKETRQVSIFINGAEVENSIKSIAAEQRKLTNELAKTIRGTVEYETKATELRKVNTILREHRQAVSGIKQGWDLTKAGLEKFVGVAAGAFAVDRIISFGKELLNQADAQLKADAQIKAAIRSTGGVAGKSLQELKTQAEELQKVTLFGDEQTEGAQALLLTFKSIRGEIFDQTIPLVQDLATAFKQDLNSSAVQVGKALEDPIKGVTALRRVGITFTEGQRAMIKSLVETGDVAAAQTIILKELETQVGGSARAAAQAGAGPLQVLTNQLGEIEEAAGGVVVDLVQDLAPALNDVTSAVLDFLTVPVSETLEKERQAFNGLSLSILNADEGTKERTEGIKNLQKEYPQFLANIDAEKATNEQLKPILDKINQSYIIRIALQKQQEKVTPLLEAQADAVNDLAEKSAAFHTQLARGAEISGVNLQAYKTEAEQIQAVQAALRKQIDERGPALFAQEDQKVLGQILQFQKLIATATGRQAVAANNVTSAEKQRQTVVEELKKTYGDLSVQLAAGFSGKEENEDPETPGGKNTIKEAEKLAKDLEALIERTTAARLDLISKAQDDELAATIRGIEKRYDAEIAKALELEKKGVEDATAQRIVLEQLKQDEITLAIRKTAEKTREEQEKKDQKEKEDALKKELDYWAKVAEERDKFLNEKADAEAEIKEFTNEALLGERELELLGVEEQYQKLLGSVDKYGGDKAALTEAYRKRIREINKKYDKEQKEEDELTLKERTEALAAAFTGFGDLAMATYDLLGKEGEKGAELQKIATLAKIAFDTAAAIASLMAASEGNPLNLLTGGAAGIAQFATGLARILATAGQAKKILSGAPQVKQKAAGGYLSVTGADDGRTYSASVIPTPYTGLLPPHPVLFQSHATGAPVLASERGQEYFVSSDALRNPYVANLTRMIDNIAGPGRRGVQQFAEGGDNPSLPAEATAPATAGVDMRIIERNTAVMEALLSAIERGIVAVIPDRTLTAIPERLGKINKASGGFYG